MRFQHAASARRKCRPDMRDVSRSGACGQPVHLLGCDECVCTARHRGSSRRRTTASSDSVSEEDSMVSETGWSLHPDRALPSDPVVRPIAREILAATATLPIVSMHGHVDARPAGARRAVRGPGVAAGHARPLPGAHAGVPGRAARRPRGAPPGPAGRRRGPARGLADLRDALAAVPRDADALLAGARLRRGVRAGRAALGRLRRPALRPPLRAAGEAGVPAAARSSTSSASRSWRPPTRRPRRSPTTRTWRTAAGATGSCRRSGPTRCCTSTAPAGRRTSRCSRSGRGSRSVATATWCARSRSVGVRSSPPGRAPRTTGTSPRTRPR